MYRVMTRSRFGSGVYRPRGFFGWFWRPLMAFGGSCDYFYFSSSANGVWQCPPITGLRRRATSFTARTDRRGRPVTSASNIRACGRSLKCLPTSCCIHSGILSGRGSLARVVPVLHYFAVLNAIGVEPGRCVFLRRIFGIGKFLRVALSGRGMPGGGWELRACFRQPLNSPLLLTPPRPR